MELKQYVQMLWRWAWLIVLCALLAGTSAFIISRQMTPIYEASTTLLIFQAPATSATPDYTSILTSERLAQTYAELLKKKPVLDAVIANLNLDVDAETLRDNMRVTVVRDTQLIVLTLEWVNPETAATIANEMVKVFIEQNEELQASRYATSRQSLEQELASIQSDIDATQQRLDDLSDLGNALPGERERLDTLMSEYRSTYATVLQSLEQVRLTEAQSTNNLNVVEPAHPNFDPVRPRTTLNTLLAVIVGTMLAVGVAFLMEYLNDRIRSGDEVEQLTGLPVLAAIARIKGIPIPAQIVSSGGGRSPIAESYRMLRANIEFSAVDRTIRTLLVTSSSPGEGKSTTVSNLATTMALAGQRVIVVDADLRRPTQHAYFQLPNEHGLTNALLREGNDYSDCLLTTNVHNLRVMPSGPLPPNPAELLGSQRMAHLVASLKQQADVIVFDSPPVLSVVDAALLAHSTDATLMVVQSEATRAGALTRAREQLAQAGVRLIGSVFNKVAKARDGYYYYYYYGEDKRRKRRNGHDTPSNGNGHSNGNGNGHGHGLKGTVAVVEVGDTGEEK